MESFVHPKDEPFVHILEFSLSTTVARTKTGLDILSGLSFSY